MELIYMNFFQLFKEKRLSKLNVTDISETIISTLDLPKALQGNHVLFVSTTCLSPLSPLTSPHVVRYFILKVFQCYKNITKRVVYLSHSTITLLFNNNDSVKTLSPESLMQKQTDRVNLVSLYFFRLVVPWLVTVLYTWAWFKVISQRYNKTFINSIFILK